MKTIYLDVLIVLNIYVNFFLLKGTARFLHLPLKFSRCTISSVFGSLFSLTILLPDMNIVISMLIKLTAAVLITAVCFGIKNKGQYVKILIYFYIINFIFAGIMGFLYSCLKPSFMAFNNAYFYVDFSLLSLVVFTAAAYLILTVVRRIMDKSTEIKGQYSIKIFFKSNEYNIPALADTGNSLADNFSGKPVVICNYKDIGFNEEIFEKSPEELYMEYSMRVIPYSTIGNNGLIPVFSPESVEIVCGENNVRKKADVLIGISKNSSAAIFNPELLL